jgi:hypothetical protein
MLAACCGEILGRNRDTWPRAARAQGGPRRDVRYPLCSLKFLSEMVRRGSQRFVSKPARSAPVYPRLCPARPSLFDICGHLDGNRMTLAPSETCGYPQSGRSLRR